MNLISITCRWVNNNDMFTMMMMTMTDVDVDGNYEDDDAKLYFHCRIPTEHCPMGKLVTGLQLCYFM